MYHFLDWKTGEPLTADDGILIQRRTAEVSGLDVGDVFELSVGGINTATVRVAGIFENYIGRNMLMSREHYRALYGEDCEDNTFLVRLNGADADELEGRLAGIEGFEKCTASDELRKVFASSTTVVNGIIALFIFMAIVMAGVVLLNLTNIYILQKKRELTVMRINGFTVREVIGYVLRETVFTTSLGILTGIAMGAAIGYRIVRSIEQSYIQFERGVSINAWLFGALTTVVFACAVNAVVLRKVKDLKLTDVV